MEQLRFAFCFLHWNTWPGMRVTTTHTAQGKKGGSRGNRHSRLTSPRVAAACAQRQQPPPRELNKRVEAPSGCIPKGSRTTQRHSRQRAACPLPPRTCVSQRGTHSDLDSRRVSRHGIGPELRSSSKNKDIFSTLI